MKKTILIIGSGPGGYIAAIRAAQLGCSVQVIERDRLGGVCLQHGCIPVKALLHSARMYENARNASQYGIVCPDVSFDYARMMIRKNDIIAINEQGISSLFKKHGIRLIRGKGKLMSPKRIKITGLDGDTSVVEADHIVIATGSSSLVPSFVNLDQERIVDCEGALALQTLPKSMVILGGGVLGCEFASLYNAFGVKVTIIEKLHTLMPLWDCDLSRRLTASFKRRSIDVRTDMSVEGLHKKDPSGKVIVALSNGSTVTADCCLAAFGRKPNIENIGMDEAGIVLWKDSYRGIQVNEYLQTNIPTVYAVGDVTGIRPLAPVASAQGITAVEHACGMGTPMRYNAVPDCFWAFPELGSVGCTEQDARERGLDISIAHFHYRSSSIAHVIGATEGFVKAIVEKGSDIVLGIHICGENAPEMVAEASVIVSHGLTVDDIKHTIHAHPTMGEILKEAVLAVKGENIHG